MSYGLTWTYKAVVVVLPVIGVEEDKFLIQKSAKPTQDSRTLPDCANICKWLQGGVF